MRHTEMAPPLQRAGSRGFLQTVLRVRTLIIGLFLCCVALMLFQTKLVTVTEGKGDPSKDVLIETFRNGYLLVDQKCSEIRDRAKIEGCPAADKAA